MYKNLKTQQKEMLFKVLYKKASGFYIWRDTLLILNRNSKL